MNWQRKRETRLHITTLLLCCGTVLWAGIVYSIQTVLCMMRCRCRRHKTPPFLSYSKCSPASHLEVVFSAMGQPLGLILAWLPWFMIPASMLLTCRCAYGPRHGSTCQTPNWGKQRKEKDLAGASNRVRIRYSHA